MSYDYNALVADITRHRRHAAAATAEGKDDATAHLQAAVDAFSTLSTACPMTPLLWMKYAFDASKLIKLFLNNSQEASQMRLQTLQLGLAEFPSCAPLWLHYLQIVVSHKQLQEQNGVQKDFEEALTKVGQGSHRNEGEIVASIYRLYVNHLATSTKDPDVIVEIFVRRAQTPIKDANDAIMDEFQQFCQSHQIQVKAGMIQRLEGARMWVAKTFSSLSTWQDEVDMAMHEEGILSRHQLESSLETEKEWNALMDEKQEEGRFWMGLGGAKSANAFVKLARACTKYSCPHEQDHDEQLSKEEIEKRIRDLALSVYERGVSECPTVESLWLSYLRHLTYLLKPSDNDNAPSVDVPSKLQSVAARAVRNCPYSLPLYQQQIEVLAALAKTGHAVLEPDALMLVVQGAIDAKFLQSPQSYLELHMAAIRAIKRHVLFVVSKATASTSTTNGQEGKVLSFDEAQTIEKAGTRPCHDVVELDEETEQEVQDLIEDLREIYDTTDDYLRKNHKSWNVSRTILWKERAKTESYVLSPLMACLDDDENETKVKDSTKEMIRCYEKLVRLHQPTHPDCYLEYIASVMAHHDASTPGAIIARLRKVRGLYQKALASAKKRPNNPQEVDESVQNGYRDVETALRCLCHEYLEFELCFGSEQSYASASKGVKKKLLAATIQNGGSRSHHTSQTQSISIEGPPPEEKESSDSSSTDAKRKIAHAAPEQPLAKKHKAASYDEPQEEASPISQTEKKVNLKVPKQYPEYKVRVGKLDYPAHPFTVKVSNLSLETQDMDLVDFFKSRCGPIVHARILREMHHGRRVGKSRGFGLVQFEERSSVEKALELSDEIGLNKKLVKVERSHMRAADVVPAGMHRPHPKGEGRHSKKNQGRNKSHADDVAEKGTTEKPKAATANKGKPFSSILAFRPRGVAHGHAHRKVHLEISQNEKKGNTEKDNST